MFGVKSKMTIFDLNEIGVRGLNSTLHELKKIKEKSFMIKNPMGRHAIACGLNAPISVEIDGHVGFYCGGMNQKAEIEIKGHAGVGVGENMMSGKIHVYGDVSESAGATAHGGILVIEGNSSSRCGISMKGISIVVKGSVGHMSAFMAQSGYMVVCGDAGDALGDSIYEAELFVRGKVASLGVDCIEKEMTKKHLTKLNELLENSCVSAKPLDFRRYGSKRSLYNFNIDNVNEY
tara:strand:+ start:266 stop:967 length:702 start_codon:yes stop_codon:yes gene_type:complete